MSVATAKQLPAPPAEIVELTEDVSGSPYFNHDMAPTPWAERKWGEVTAREISGIALIVVGVGLLVAVQ